MFYAVVCATLTSFYELSRNYSKCSVAVEENLHQFISFVINFDRGEARRLPFVGVLNIFVLFPLQCLFAPKAQKGITKG